MNRSERVNRLVLLTGVLTALTCCVGLTGCGGGATDERATVAKVGDRKIELRQVTDYITALQVNYPTADAELAARRRQLDRLIEEQLLILGAYSQALDADIGIVELVDREKDKFLLDELFRQEVIDKATVDEDEIREVYSHWFERVRASHIVVETKAEADSLLTELNAGADFGDLAERHSIDQRTAVRGGDFGREFRWSELISPLRELVFSLKEGETGGPVQTDYGWHIVRIESRRELEKQPFDELRTPIESQLRRIAQNARRLEQLGELRERSNIQLVPDGWTAFREQVDAITDTLAGVARARGPILIDSLSDAVRNITVATYGTEGTVTLVQMADRFNSIPWERRPDVSNREQMEEMVFQIGLYDLLRAEALRLRMDEQPLYQERLLEFHEKLMADKMRSTIVSQNLRLPEEDVLAYYEAYPDSFIEPTAYHVREVMVHDTLLARDILEQARRGTSLEELAKQHTERPSFKASGGDLGWITPDRYPDLYEPASQLKPGEVGGPYSGVDQHSIIEVLEVRPPRQQSYEEIQASLFNKIQKHRSDSILAAYIDSAKVIYPVEIQEDVLRADLHVPEEVAN